MKFSQGSPNFQIMIGLSLNFSQGSPYFEIMTGFESNAFSQEIKRNNTKKSLKFLKVLKSIKTGMNEDPLGIYVGIQPVKLSVKCDHYLLHHIPYQIYYLFYLLSAVKFA